MTRISGDLVRHKLPTHVFGQNVVYAEQTGSTNTELKSLARWGAPEGLLYLTNEQLAGRGRLDRSWYAPADSSLLLSLLFRPEEWLAPHQAQRLTMLCALAMIKAIEKHTGLSPGLKWPNDLIWHDGKKLAGVLTELETEDYTLSWAVVGLGLNVNINFQNQAETELYQPGSSGNGNPPLSQTATSLSMLLGQDTAELRLPILQSFLVNVEGRYEALRQGWLPHQEWSRSLVGMGQPVTVINVDGSGKRRGIMAGVNEDGALLLKRPDGPIETILAGDVTLRHA